MDPKIKEALAALGPLLAAISASPEGRTALLQQLGPSEPAPPPVGKVYTVTHKCRMCGYVTRAELEPGAVAPGYALPHEEPAPIAAPPRPTAVVADLAAPGAVVVPAPQSAPSDPPAPELTAAQLKGLSPMQLAARGLTGSTGA